MINKSSCPFTKLFLSPPPPITLTSPPWRQRAATPLGPSSPGQQSRGQILRGEYVDFTSLLPDSLSQPQVPEIQLPVEASIPGCASPVSMVQKQKLVSVTFRNGWTLILVVSCPQHSQDHSILENWRPISFVNINAKIMSKVLVTRIKNVLPDLIHHNQSGFVKDRYTPGQLSPVLRHLNEAINGFSTVSILRRSGSYSVWV